MQARGASEPKNSEVRPAPQPASVTAPALEAGIRAGDPPLQRQQWYSKKSGLIPSLLLGAWVIGFIVNIVINPPWKAMSWHIALVILPFYLMLALFLFQSLFYTWTEGSNSKSRKIWIVISMLVILGLSAGFWYGISVVVRKVAHDTCGWDCDRQYTKLDDGWEDWVDTYTYP